MVQEPPFLKQDKKIVLGFVMSADGSGQNLLHIPAGGTALPATVETIQNRQHFLK
jgi:3-oxoacyl-[acyl-carrier-protein] synthase-3